MAKVPWDDKIHEECGIAAMAHSENCLPIIVTALHALQHRGTESCGVAVSRNGYIRAYRRIGLVAGLAKKTSQQSGFNGNIVIGHTRYSTTGASNLANSQPILIDYKNGQLAIAHNGNLTNANELRRKMEGQGSIFHSTNDSEVILHLIARSKKRDLGQAILESLAKVKGAFSLVFASGNTLIAARDPLGVRPLCLGRFRGKSYMVASESCAFDIVGAEYVRDVEPGEVLFLEKNRTRSLYLRGRSKKRAHCVFEFIYFSRPDSRIFGENVDKLRRAFGRKLAEEYPCDADCVISVPDSSNTAALGYAQASGLPFEIGLIRNHYVGRTFISPVQGDREAKVKLKFNPVKGVIKNKRVVVVEDSIVRGTTLRHLVSLIKNAGAKKIHVRVSSPPIKNPCHYGMDFPSRGELIATNKTIEQTRKYLGVDSLAHLSIPALRDCVGADAKNFCDACFSGKYPIRVNGRGTKFQFDRVKT